MTGELSPLGQTPGGEAESIIASAHGADAPAAWTAPATMLVVDARCVALLDDEHAAALTALQATVLDVPGILDTDAASALAGAGAVLLAAQTVAGERCRDVLERLRQVAPHLSVYVIARSALEVASSMPLFGACGVDDVFVLETSSDTAALDATLRVRLAAPQPEAEIRMLWRWHRDLQERSLVMHCIRNAFHRDDWSSRCRVFGASRKTLQNRLLSIGLPTPGVVARLGRVLHAQELERRGVPSSREIARRLGYPSGSAMRRTRRRLRGTLLERGGHAAILSALIQEPHPH